jgi:transposase
MPSMPQRVANNQDDHRAAEHVVLGVDTHSDRHVAAVLTTLGTRLGSASFAATAAGYQELVALGSDVRSAATSWRRGTGSNGAALARHLHAAGIEVIEVNAPDKATRRRRGKTDTLDAEAPARAVLSGRASATAKSGTGPVEMHVQNWPRPPPSRPAPRQSTNSKPCWWRPTQPCARHCRA